MQTRTKKLLTTTFALALSSGLVALAEEEENGSKLFAGFNMTDGNSETLNLTLGGASKGETDGGEYFVDALFAYSEADNETTAENFIADAQYNHLLNEDAYVYLAGDFLYDDFADIDYRVIVGPGLGHYLLNGDDHKLAAEVGVVWIAEEVADEEDDGFAFRFAERSEHAVSENASVYQSVEYLPYIDDFDDYLLNAEAGIDAAINSTLSLTAFVLNRYDSTPAPGLDENDLSVNAGLTYRL